MAKPVIIRTKRRRWLVYQAVSGGAGLPARCGNPTAMAMLETASRAPVGESRLLERLDPGIRRAVEVLRDAGIETFESCQGGDGHAFAEPTVRFAGDRSEGFRAFAACFEKHDLRVLAVRRVWQVAGGELEGPFWEITFLPERAPHEH